VFRARHLSAKNDEGVFLYAALADSGRKLVLGRVDDTRGGWSKLEERFLETATSAGELVSMEVETVGRLIRFRCLGTMLSHTLSEADSKVFGGTGAVGFRSYRQKASFLSLTVHEYQEVLPPSVQTRHRRLLSDSVLVSYSLYLVLDGGGADAAELQWNASEMFG
jgi:hypothetical protein